MGLLLGRVEDDVEPQRSPVPVTLPLDRGFLLLPRVGQRFDQEPQPVIRRLGQHLLGLHDEDHVAHGGQEPFIEITDALIEGGGVLTEV
jgi:hypothetical protein